MENDDTKIHSSEIFHLYFIEYQQTFKRVQNGNNNDNKMEFYSIFPHHHHHPHSFIDGDK